MEKKAMTKKKQPLSVEEDIKKKVKIAQWLLWFVIGAVCLIDMLLVFYFIVH